MTSHQRALLYSPPIAGLVFALGWAVVDRALRPLGMKAQN